MEPGQPSTPDSNPRLLLLTADSGPGGTMRWLRNIQPHLASHYDTAVVLRAPLGDEPPIRLPGVTLHQLPLLSLRAGFGSLEMLRILRAHRPDVILASGFTSLLCLLVIRWLRLHPRIPVLMVQRGVLREFAHVSQWKAKLALWLSSFAVGAGDHIAAVAPNAREYLRDSRYRRWPVEIISNGIPLAELPPRRPPRPDSALQIGVIGRLSFEKGADRLPAIVAALPDATATLHIVGVGEYEPDLRTALSDAVTAGQVVFHGWLDHPVELLAGLDLLLLPSRTEACPHVVLEAFALDVPVWATAVGGVPYILDDGRAGRLFEGVEELLSALRKLDRPGLARMRPHIERGRALMQERYAETTMVNTYLKRLDELRSATL